MAPRQLQHKSKNNRKLQHNTIRKNRTIHIQIRKHNRRHNQIHLQRNHRNTRHNNKPPLHRHHTNQTTLTTQAGQINSSGHIILQANATADGTDRSTIFFYDTAIHTPRYYTCGSVTNSTGNIYGCQFDTTGKAVGDYNITMIGYKNFHNNGTNFTLNGIKIKSSPTLANGTVDISSDGWGVQRTFSVNVTDNTGDTVTVKAYEDLGLGFVEIGEQTCTSCAGTQLKFNSTYLCSEIRDSNNFKFNATDTVGTEAETFIFFIKV